MKQETSTFDELEAASSIRSLSLSLDALRSFVAICETGSFRRAAARVCRSPSAVSLQIATLEEILGVQLLERNARHVALTEAGDGLLGRARLMIGINDEIIGQFRGSSLLGELYLVAPHDLGISLVPRLLRRLSEGYPGIRVNVRLGATHFVQQQFESGAAQLALLNDVDAPAIKAERLFSEPLRWLMLDGGRAAEHDPLPLATAEVGCAWRGAALAALDTVKRGYSITYSSDTAMGQIAAVRADLAIAALPLSVAGRELVEVPEHHQLPHLPDTHIWLCTNGSEPASAFGDIAKADAGR